MPTAGHFSTKCVVSSLLFASILDVNSRPAGSFFFIRFGIRGMRNRETRQPKKNPRTGGARHTRNMRATRLHPHRDHPPSTIGPSTENSLVMYPPNAFDSRLRGDKVPLGSSPTKSQKKRLFGLAARNRLSLSLPLSFSSSSYFLSYSIQRSTVSCSN